MLKELYNINIQSKENFSKGDIETGLKKSKEFFEFHGKIPTDYDPYEIIQKNIEENHEKLIEKYNEILIIIDEEIPQLIIDHKELC